MARQKTVIDASVIVKWFVDEEGTEKALKLRADHIDGRILIAVPELLFLEVLNALRYKGATIRKLNEANDALWDIQLQVEKTNKFILEKANELAMKHNLSLYDAIYLAFAIVNGSPLITADKQLAKADNTIIL